MNGSARIGMKMKPRFTLLSSTACLVLSACVSVEEPDLPQSDVPQDWEGPVASEAQVWPDLDWWRNFRSQELDTIIRTVRENNLNLQNNRRNLRSAQISLEEAGFDLLPTPSVTVGTDAQYSDDLSGSGDLPGDRASSTSESASLSGSLSYNNILSKPATYDGAVANYNSRRAQVAETALNTLGTAASTYFQILLIRDRIEAAEQNLANAEAIGSITQARVDAGVAVPIDALQQRIAIEQQRTNLESLHQDELAARSSLSILTGQSVQGFTVEGDTLEAITTPELRPGIPSELLRRRPDLVQAEADLQRTVANVELSRLGFFPRISLNGNSNASSTSLTQLASSPDAIINITADLTQTLLDNGQRSRDLEQSRITMENSLNSYRNAVLGAFNEIEVALSNIRLLDEQLLVAQQNLDAAEEAFRIAEVRYAEGAIDFQRVLTAQNTLFSSRTSYLNRKIQLLNAMINFYQALGGGWDADDESTMEIITSQQ